ncbi:hypothetical protein F5Y16DRAFT_366441 [Xylariaceae sp. FL0255]|nr:hypothetical protein F5Y16DRAFT_366441 [Xylariaceae sp. FL0255]
MPRAGAKRARQCDDASEDSDIVLPEKHKNQPSKTRVTKKNIACLEEYDEDEGRESSRGFQKMAQIFATCTEEEAKKSREHIGVFKRAMRKQVKDLKALVAQKEKELFNIQEGYTAIFDQACSALADGASGERRAQRNDLIEDAKALTAEAHSLMREVQVVEEEVGKTTLDLPEPEWISDKQGIKEILEQGTQHGYMLTGCALVPGSHPSPPPAVQSRKEKLARALFSDDVLDEETWGNTAQEQINYFTAFTKTLPLSVETEE